MKETDNLQEELREIAPFLSNMKVEGDGFKVPENYFKNLPDEIIEQLSIESQEVVVKSTKQWDWFESLLNNLKWLWQPRTGLVFTSILLVVFAGSFLFKSPADTEGSINLSDISLEELESYFEENMDEYDTELLVEGNEKLLEDEFGNDDELDRYFEEIIEESELEDLL